MSHIFETAKAVYTYESFLDMTETLLQEGKTTGINQSDMYLHYAKLNQQRMKRWNKTFELRKDIAAKMATVQPQQWWVITEGWCGDSAQNLPVIHKMAEASQGKVSLRIVLRDENPEIMDQLLTDGKSRSIPILAALDADGKLLFRWGPRPEGAHELLTAWKNSAEPSPFDEFELEMHTWYSKNKGNAVQDEIGGLLQN